MEPFVLGFEALGRNSLVLVGGKSANLAMLSRLEGLQVPEGFCLTTSAFQAVVGEAAEVQALLARLSDLKAQDRKELAALCAEIRQVIETLPFPETLEQELVQALKQRGETDAYAVRSSASAEDLPSASFAGQMESYLQLVGSESILQQIRKCWASLFTERAVSYRLQNGFGLQSVQMAVLVQKMVFPQAAGVLFSADPLTCNRKVLAIEACFGLGEALVSGQVTPDHYWVRDGEIMATQIAPQNEAQVLTQDQILELARLGRQIEAAFEAPQDIEWALADKTFYILQARPITTLFPIPNPDAEGHHVYLSVGHQQMMTDPLKPLGMSLYLLITRAAMYPAGGRLFVDCPPCSRSLRAARAFWSCWQRPNPSRSRLWKRFWLKTLCPCRRSQLQCRVRASTGPCPRLRTIPAWSWN